MFRSGRTLCLAMVMLALAARAGAQQEPAGMPDMPGMDHSMHAGMSGMEGPLGLGHARQGSGTSWLPDASPMRSAMWQKRGWMLMLHGQLFAQYVATSGDRGDRQFGSANWFMAMAGRDLAGGQVTGRAMVSGERLTVGLCGYPDLAQTGVKCGSSLRDLQHPHDLFMELGADYRRAITESVAIELYGGPAGEPALGPAAFPHRLSALPNPAAPIAHHWLDVTHITFGVVTGGVYGRTWKAEASAFNGRHPDEERYGFDLAPLKSTSGRFWWLPTPEWAIQVSSGRLLAPEGHNHSPDAKDVALFRTTASATYHRMQGSRVWATTVAWGQNRSQGVTTQSALAETAVDLSDKDTLFGRAELVERTPADVIIGTLELDTTKYSTAKLQGGYTRTIGRLDRLECGIGGAVGLVLVPDSLSFVYGGRSAGELSVFFSIRPTKD